MEHWKAKFPVEVTTGVGLEEPSSASQEASESLLVESDFSCQLVLESELDSTAMVS